MRVASQVAGQCDVRCPRAMPAPALLSLLTTRCPLYSLLGARSTLSTHYSVPALLTSRCPLYSLLGARSTHYSVAALLTSRCPLYSLYSVHLYTVPLHRAYPLRLHRLLLTYLLTVLTILTMRRVACAAHELRGKLLLYLLHLLYLPWQSKAPAKDVTIKYK